MWQTSFDHWNCGNFFLHPRAHRVLDALSENDLFDSSLPAAAAIFRAFELVRPADVRVVILGQDPYPKPEDAMGLAFSSPAPRLPASLRNIFKELANDLGKPPPGSGDLSHWSAQGVLLANAALTVGLDGKSHLGYWTEFTQTWIGSLAGSHPIVWVLWGKHAQAWKATIHETGAIAGIEHVIVESVHPSPLSAHRGFFGSQPFSKINRSLNSMGHTAIDW